ncbi:ABC transporter permease subunit [Vibrio sp. SS-MA-C1-2]|uniref:ABC transporter permease n=1 Tax=Vibrio sp. SS-MA-C1-2 TaxID=2908646 RepID=UPI001F19F673|nr:ABC transporter permease subunit [Vibrio sp. SS-MA-C1-2]UJF19980.1 ABC transporter permease subunit [Vibrio sp. SS-MA-C1-2]
MLIYTIRRLILFITTLLLITVVGFSILRLDTESPWFYQSAVSGWWNYLLQVLQGNFGRYPNGVPVVSDIIVLFPATLELIFIAFCVSLLIGIPVGTLAGMSRNSLLDKVITSISLVGYSIPIFWLAIILILFFSINLEWLPVSGRYNLLYDIPHITGISIIDILLSDIPHKQELLQNVIEHLVLPTIVLAVAPTTEVIGQMRSSVAEVMTQNYIKAAATKGLSRFNIVFRHVLKNAIPPIIPSIGIQLSTMLTLATLTEFVFNRPGIGRWLLDAVAQQNYLAIQAGIVTVAVFILVASIISELVGAIVNPLLRKEFYAIR